MLEIQIKICQNQRLGPNWKEDFQRYAETSIVNVNRKYLLVIPGKPQFPTLFSPSLNFALNFVVCGIKWSYKGIHAVLEPIVPWSVFHQDFLEYFYSSHLFNQQNIAITNFDISVFRTTNRNFIWTEIEEQKNVTRYIKIIYTF